MHMWTHGDVLQLLALLAALTAMWIRMEVRITRVEDRVRERYRDKKAIEDRLTKLEEKFGPWNKPASD